MNKVNVLDSMCGCRGAATAGGRSSFSANKQAKQASGGFAFKLDISHHHNTCFVCVCVLVDSKNLEASESATLRFVDVGRGREIENVV